MALKFQEVRYAKKGIVYVAIDNAVWKKPERRGAAFDPEPIPG